VDAGEATPVAVDPAAVEFEFGLHPAMNTAATASPAPVSAARRERPVSPISVESSLRGRGVTCSACVIRVNAPTKTDLALRWL
jgi:hypothetical protein